MEYKTTLNNINRNPIAFFDSGVGGLTVFSKVKKILPNENYIYFGDTKNLPYGEKSEEELIEFAGKIFDFFEQEGVKAVVMACNTTSAVTYEKLKDKYNFKIYPIIQSVCSTISALDNLNKLAVIATPATINSHAYLREIKKHKPSIQVFEISAPKWVHIVEEGRINSPECYEDVKEILYKLPKVDKIVLACTHYPYLLKTLEKFAPAEKFIDPSDYFAQNIKTDLQNSRLLNNQSDYEKFYVSSSPENFLKSSQMFYKSDRLPELKIL